MKDHNVKAISLKLNRKRKLNTCVARVHGVTGIS